MDVTEVEEESSLRLGVSVVESELTASAWRWGAALACECRFGVVFLEWSSVGVVEEDKMKGGRSLGGVGRGLLLEKVRKLRPVSLELDEFREEVRVAI